MSSMSLFIFRRDLRLQDNTALNAALKDSSRVHCAFVFTPEQKDHPFFSENGFQFMVASLEALQAEFENNQATLNFYVGATINVLAKIKTETNFETLYLNKDYTPFARARDEKIKAWCTQHHITFKAFDDATLNPPEKTTKDDRTPYKVFTPYYHNASNFKVLEPHTEKLSKLSDQKLKQALPLQDIAYSICPKKNNSIALKGGRGEALEIYKNLNKNYDQARDFPAQSVTSYLSAHHKFGTVSMRESYYQLGAFYGFEHTIISELYWHDFFTHIGYFYPHVFKKSFTPKFEHLSWENDEEKFKAWCKGQTGFPIVDAGMRELNKTGYMHNRVRMITASFLIKNLNIDWHWGEQYFAQKLIDYDPAINNGNWQWAASTGVDAQPFFRIFNPWRQQERFDPNSVYIKQWVPELKDLSSKEINHWHTEGHSLFTNYPSPIVEHKKTSDETKHKYRQAHESAKAIK